MHATSTYLSCIRFTLFFLHTKLLGPLFLFDFFFTDCKLQIIKSLVFLCPVAERISKERGGNVGEDIGYKVMLLMSCLDV